MSDVTNMAALWQQLDATARAHGERFYLLDIAAFHQNYAEFLGEFRRIYPATNLAYSYKTNYIPDLCAAVDHLGGYAEVVSHMEYAVARRVGVAPERIIFNGPYKRAEEIEAALLGGGVVNLDSPYEVPIVVDIARRRPEQTLLIGIRCNFDVGVGQPSRFGFDVASGALEAALQTLRAPGNCRVVGLHCHFMVPQKRAAAYTLIADRMLELAAMHFAPGELRFIDLGGGFFSKMAPALQREFGHPIATFQEYAEAIAPRFARAWPDGDGPELLLEPGIALVADVMSYVARVVDVKTVQGRSVALLAGSVYEIKPTLNARNLPATLVPSPGVRHSQQAGVVDLVGYTCMEHDLLYRDFAGAVAPGDFVVFQNVGAYTVVLKPPFINPAPAILATEDDTIALRVVRRSETNNDLFQSYTWMQDETSRER